MPRKAALKASKAIDEPNLIIPLATSYNERGVAGYTHAVTNSEDQRKVNCFYELAKNAATGKGTLTLAKRPGVTIDSHSFGTSDQASYLVAPGSGGAANIVPYVFSTITAGADIRVSDSASSQTIVSGTVGYLPYIVDRTSISNVPYLVLQTQFGISSAQRIFYVIASNPIAVWSEITDADFTPGGVAQIGKMEHIDGFALILLQNNLIINSDSNSLANWTAANFLAKQIQQDAPVGLARIGNMLLAFGENTVESFYNSGNTAGSPLGRIAHNFEQTGLVPTTTGVGVGGTNYYATIQKQMYFVGRRSGGMSSLGVFTCDGSNIIKISSPYIDKIISENLNSIYSVTSVGHNGQSAVAICFTAPGAATQRWLMFYPDWKEWFEWNSTVFSPVNSGSWFLGSSSRNRVYNITSSDNFQDNATSYSWSTQFKLPTNGSSRRFMPMYGIDADTDTSANSLTVEISTDDSKTFSTLGTIDQTQDRKVLFRGGSFRKAHIRLGNTNARPTRIHNFLARIE